MASQGKETVPIRLLKFREERRVKKAAMLDSFYVNASQLSGRGELPPPYSRPLPHRFGERSQQLEELIAKAKKNGILKP